LLLMKPGIGTGGSLLAPRGGWHVEFQNVTFRYPSRPNVVVLDDVSFSVSPGESIGIVGHTGAGKSTITALLLRLYDPTSGMILINGSDLKEYNVYRSTPTHRICQSGFSYARENYSGQCRIRIAAGGFR